MPGNSGVYAGKSRKKPVHKSAKPPSLKTNPSKRHRDRLNGELDSLTGMLPFSEEVRGRLDKLSVLRLSLGYLKVKSYFNVALQKHVKSAPLVSASSRNGQSVSLDGVSFSEGDLLLQALNGFVLVVATDGTIFYTSPTMQDFLGFHQSDVVHQNVHDLVHTEDREMFRCQLHFALKPGDSHSDVRAQDGQSSGKAASGSVSSLPQYVPSENSSFLDRSFCCRLRCLLDNNSGFLALNFNGRLKYLHLQGSTSPPQLALFAIATPLQPPSVMAIRTKTFIFQSKHTMDYAPVGIDTRGKLALGYTEIELVTTGSGYQFIHAADMMYCADNHLRMIKTGDSGFSCFRLLTKAGRWLWVQATSRIVFKGGRPDFIIARQKALTNEEGEEHLHQRRQQLPFNLATGEGVLYDVCLESIPGLPGSGAPGTGEPATEKPLDPASLLGSLRRQDYSVYAEPQEPIAELPLFTEIEIEDPGLEQPQATLEHAFLDSHALLSVPVQTRGSRSIAGDLTSDSMFDSLEQILGDIVEQPQATLEHAFLDSHALLSVPGQTRGSRSIAGDLTSESMFDSLEQILGDIVDGGLEGLDVEETELRDWENTLARLSDEREDASMGLNHILANDVFSYVEEALRRETAEGSHLVSGSFTKLSIQAQRPGGSAFSNDEWQQTMDATSAFAEQAAFGDVLGAAGYSPARCRNAPQGHASSPWPPGSQTTSTQPWLAAGTQHSRPPSVRIPGGGVHRGGRRPGSDQTVQYTTLTGSQQARTGPQLQSPPAWQQFNTLTHSSHAARSTGSCMYEATPNAAAPVPAGQNGPLLGPPCSGGTANVPLGWPRPGGDVGPGMAAAVAAGRTGVGNVSLGAAPSEFAPGSGSIQSSFFCWSAEDQIPTVSLNGVADPFAFSGLPTGSVNLPQNSGP